MKYEKPITQNVKDRAGKILDYLRFNRRFCTKHELMKVSGCTNERSVRDVINLLRNLGCCIVSASDRKGYYLALNKGDLELVEHAWRETDKRIQELESMKSCFVKFYDKMRYTNG